MRNGKKGKSKTKSIIWLTLLVVAIGIASYLGAKGATIFDGKYKIQSFGETIKRGLDLKGGVSLVMEIQENNVDQKTLDRTIDLIRLRVNKLGVSETTVTKEGTKRIRIEIPGVYDPKSVADTVGKTGKLTFVGPEPEKELILEGKDVKDATAGLNPETNQYDISLELNEEGKKKFAEATKKYIGKPIAIYMDSDELVKPTVQVQITDGKAAITGNRSLEEAKNIASLIKAGALPVTVKTVETKTVGATLGNNALSLSVKAGVIGVGLVFLFMILYYKVPGLIADIALTLYILLVLGTFSSIGAVLTLSGIAGFLLTIGMAVDANVLIFERIREELRTGKSVRSALDAGFHRALSSILDSNITTIISGLVLYSFGTDAVKGFALTLMIGVILSMFTAVTITRLLLKLSIESGVLKSPRAFGVKLEKGEK